MKAAFHVRQNQDANKSSATDTSKGKSNHLSALQLADNRDEAAVQRRLQNIASASLQAKRISGLQSMASSSEVAQKKGGKAGLPGDLKQGLESLSGMSMDHVNVHYNSDKPAQLNAHAYTQGADIHVASGQEKHLAHEGWHVVQQAQGRVQPTTQMAGVQVNDEKGLEHEADVMGSKALSVGKQGAGDALQAKSSGRLKTANNSKPPFQSQSIEGGAIQRVPIGNTHPKSDLLYRNLRLLLAEMIELERDGEPKNDRQELLLGTKYKSAAEEIFSEMWLVSDDFDFLATQLRIHLHANLLLKISDNRFESMLKSIKAWSAKGEAARLQELQQKELPKSQEEESQNDSEKAPKPNPIFQKYIDIGVRAGKTGGAGNCAYLLADFLPTGHPSRKDMPMLQYLQAVKDFSVDVWRGRVDKAADMIAKAAQNTGATEVQLISGAGKIATRIYDTHVEINGCGGCPVVRKMAMNEGTTKQEVIKFIMSL